MQVGGSLTEAETDSKIVESPKSHYNMGVSSQDIVIWSAVYNLHIKQ